jgi:hypothetical protein
MVERKEIRGGPTQNQNLTQLNLWKKKFRG